MTSLAEAESKYGHVVQSAGGQIFGIEMATSVGRPEQRLKIGTPDGFVKIDVVLNQPNIDAVLRRRRRACSRAQDAFAFSPRWLFFATSIRQKVVNGVINIW